jgi:CRP-like cAMP-binding protein
MNDHSIFSPTNRILDSLKAHDFNRLARQVEVVELTHGMVVGRPHQPIEYVYFPTTAMVSVVAHSESGQSAEVSMIGREGVTGLTVITGADSTPFEAMVQIPGAGFRMAVDDVRREFEECKFFRDALLPFMHKLHIQVSQTVLCNRLHSVEQRLSKWLLMCHDRNVSDSIRVTQEFLAIMLGSSRTSVTLTAIELQKSGLISYERGNITIRDRAALEDFTCSCYAVIRDVYAAD